MSNQRVRIFKTKNFDKFSRKERISDQQLIDAVVEIENGLFEGELGGGVLKKRLATTGRGKSGSYRSIVAFRCHDRTVFMYGYPKNSVKKSGKEIEGNELREYKAFAKALFSINLDKLPENSTALIEVKNQINNEEMNDE